jgi:predicted nucleic acid-binding protein
MLRFVMPRDAVSSKGLMWSATLMAPRTRLPPVASVPDLAVAGLQLPQLDRPALFDTGAWTWVRDRRFPELATWFNAAVEAGLILVCDLVVLELTRLAPNEPRAQEVADRLAAFEAIPMPVELWSRARRTQLALATSGDHRRVPPADLLLASAAEEAGVTLVHYDRDYERIAEVSALRQEWLVPDGTLAA